MNRPSVKSSAAYGHACSNCVKAKCKCIPRESGSCERCHRLSKDCLSATSVRKRGPQRPARKSELEDKLDNLVTLLQAQRAPTPSLTPTPSNQTGEFEEVQSCLGAATIVIPALRSPKPFPSEQTPQQILSMFRARYLEYFPFIHVPIDTSIESFVCERPFTYLAIQVICETSRTRQMELGACVRKELTLRVVSGGERSIDLLLCLLVYITWQVYFTASPRGGMGMFLNVAKHVIADLGYNRPTGMVMACPKPPVIVGQLPDQHETPKDEERRALVACFALSAMTALAIKAEPMRWSSLIARACDRLAQNINIEGDTTLVAIARISRVSVDAYNTLQHIQDEPASSSHALHQVRALRTMLDIVKSNFTQEQHQNKVIICYLHSTEVQIHEPVLYDLSPSTSHAALDYQRIEYLTACLHACKSALDNYLAIPALTMNMVTVLAFSNACQTLFTLSVIDFLGWDRNAARATADVLWYFDQVVIKYEEACRQLEQETGSTDNVFSFATGHEGLKSLSAKWRASLESATGLGLDFTGEFGGVRDAWMISADMWFPNFIGTHL